MINLSNFINSLTTKSHEVLLGIDTNAPNILYNNEVQQLLQHTKLIDVIDHNHEIYKVPSTCLKGIYRTVYYFCTECISTFIDRSRITPFNEVTTSDHRRFFLDIRLRNFFKNLYTSISSYSFTTLQPINTQSVIRYKQHLKRITTEKYLLAKSKKIQDKLNNNKITHQDFTSINEFDELLTFGMIKAERIITRFGSQLPQSPTLAIAILNLSVQK